MQDQRKSTSQYNDEIDLKDLILALWKGKWVIIATIVLALIAAVGYLKMVPQAYKGQIPLKALNSLQMLPYQSNLETMPITNETLGQIVVATLQEAGVSVSGNFPNWSISFTTNQPQTAKVAWQTQMPQYLANSRQNLALQFDAALVSQSQGQKNAIAELEEQIYLAKVADIAVNQSAQITAETLPYLRGYKVLEAEVQLLERQIASLPALANPFKQQAASKLINYNLDSINLQPKIKPTLLLALAFVLGGMLGVLILIIRNVLP